MNFNDKQWEWVRWFVVVALIAVLGILQINAPFAVPATPSPAASKVGAQAIVLWKTDSAVLEGLSGSTLQMDSGSTVAFNGTVKQNGYTNACAFAAGEATNVISGTTIAHTLGVTPTMVQLTPEYTGLFTQTVYVKAHDTTSITVGISPGSVVTLTALYWMACKP